ncbi:hypothetical protein Aros01_08847 [Streptosporangium roseum]
MAAGILALFPQGLAPLGVKLSGSADRVWFLALYMPDPWQWPVIAGMILIGLASFGGMLAVYLAESRKAKEKARTEPKAREEALHSGPCDGS